jgi:hypothetical protein
MRCLLVRLTSQATVGRTAQTSYRCGGQSWRLDESVLQRREPRSPQRPPRATAVRWRYVRRPGVSTNSSPRLLTSHAAVVSDIAATLNQGVRLTYSVLRSNRLGVPRGTEVLKLSKIFADIFPRG